MTMAEYRLPINSRVRLRDGIDPQLYKGLSCTGNEGWVRNHRDDLGYPQVLVEWDRDHWSYNGAPNCWTYEEHFDLIEGIMADKKEQTPKDKEEAVRNLAEGFVKGLFRELGMSNGEIEQADDELAAKDDTPAVETTQEDMTDEAIQALRTGKAFIVVTMQENEKRGGLIYPSIYHQAESEQLALICQAQLAHLVALLQDGLIHEKIQSKKDD